MARPMWKDLDWLLLGLMACSCALGLAGIAAATGTGIHDPAMLYVLKRQLLWIVLGFFAFIVMAAIDYHIWEDWWKPLYGLALVLLIAVLGIGHHTLGARRWIAIGPFDLQPSEFAKLAVIIGLAALLGLRNGGTERPDRLRDLWVPVAFVAVPALLVTLQPDLGTSLVFFAILVGMIYVAGYPGPPLAALLVLLLGAAVGVIAAHLRWPHLVPLPLHGYQLQRILVFLNPAAYAQTGGYHILQSEMAVGSGRILGNGLFSGGAGGQLGYLPEASTDFIFASISDSLGFVGASATLLVLGLIVWRITASMAAARDTFGALLAAGVACMVGFQTVINVGVTLGLMPVTGVPLPFGSYGGSAILVNFAALGVVQSVHLRRRPLRLS